MKSFFSALFDWFLSRLLPDILKYIDDVFKKAKINREVDKETKEIKEIKRQIKEYQEKNGTNEIPAHLKEALLRASRKRVDGLR